MPELITNNQKDCYKLNCSPSPPFSSKRIQCSSPFHFFPCVFCACYFVTQSLRKRKYWSHRLEKVFQPSICFIFLYSRKGVCTHQMARSYKLSKSYSSDWSRWIKSSMHRTVLKKTHTKNTPQKNTPQIPKKEHTRPSPTRNPLATGQQQPY